MLQVTDAVAESASLDLLEKKLHCEQCTELPDKNIFDLLNLVTRTYLRTTWHNPRGPAVVPVAILALRGPRLFAFSA